MIRGYSDDCRRALVIPSVLHEAKTVPLEGRDRTPFNSY